MESVGLRVGDRVVFRCSDSPQFVAAFLAVISQGGVGVAVSTRLDDEDLATVVQDADATVFVQDEKSQDVPELSEFFPDLITIRLTEPSADDLALNSIHPVARQSGDECLWLYSSGSTSRPKGIVHTHRSISECCHFHTETLGITPNDIVFCTSKLSFAYALANGLLVPLMIGASVYLHPDWVTLSGVQRIVTSVRPKIVFSVPTIYAGLLDQLNPDELAEMASVEKFISAGEHLPPQIQDAWLRRVGRRIINVYGCSETLFLALAGNADDTPFESVGKPLPGVEASLVGSEDQSSELLPRQAVLRMSHPFMFSHYAYRRRESAAKLTNGVFSTGDLYQCDPQGNWYHQGREDDLIKVSGQWVHLREIEKICRESDAAFDVVVVRATDFSGMLKPALFFIPSSAMSAPAAIRRIRRHVERRLLKYQRPAWIRAVPDYPRTANGKISRVGLRILVEGTETDET